MDLVHNPPAATTLILLAHGGYEHSTKTPGPWRPPILRLHPFATAARTAAPAAAIGLLRYRHRGWNAAGDAAVDLRAVLDGLPGRFERVVLVGHSMGGRAVVAAGAHPRVAGVLGLAPWLPVDEPLSALRPPVTFAHGNDDRVTSPKGTVAYANRLRAAGTPVTVHLLDGETHAMLRRAEDWNTIVTTFVQEVLSGAVGEEKDRVWPAGPARGSAPAVLQIAWARLRMPVRERIRV
ncbi:dienelactone hydrolase family protein [Kribbella sandramycini]|uniref:Dienelactone hydrolase n=1 Tax=Kribbella sandramycini TaxID=60450 RepID=A0A841S048_9ACTN|nr:dienelactone hydrolase [Kribbella sandramycini]